MDRTVEEFSATSQLNDAARHSPRALSAVSWGAILAGAVGATSLSLILLILGSGLGLSSTSPWTREGAGAATLGISAILWISFTQLAASGIGGYLTGRLRTRWTGTHADEVFFRDTAHGFLAWGVATLLTATLLGSVVGSTLRGGADLFVSTAGGAAHAAVDNAKSANDGNGDSTAYYLESLFRNNKSKKGSAEVPQSEDLAEVGRIFTNSMRTGALPIWDKEYLARDVAQRTDLSQAEAEQRVSEVQARLLAAENAAKETTDKARKVSAYASLWFFISLLLGAFFASYLATFGGRLRDQ